MYPTLEVRWFSRQELPAEVLEWFGRRAALPERQPDRIDRYLRLAGADFLGIKLREGAIEIKQRQYQYGVIRFHRRVSGLLEGWRKWSFTLANASANFTNSTTAWSAVHKSRWLCRFIVLNDLKLVNVPPGETPDSGCELELTRIRVGGQRWWTVALEAFGDQAALHETLVRVGRHFFSSHQAPMLEAAASYSYPRWLDVAVSGQSQQPEQASS